MKLENIIHIKLENFDKCHFEFEVGTPVGHMYDYSCALKHFLFEEMKKAHEAEKQKEEIKEEIQPEA